jgi:7-keto-8-aminopelargonate synthetase-like enzyme
LDTETHINILFFKKEGALEMLKILRDWLKDELLASDRQEKFWQLPLHRDISNQGKCELTLPFIDPDRIELVIDCCGGNYLGGAQPIRFLDTHVGGSPLIGGYHQTHLDQEKTIASIYGGYPVLFLNVTLAAQGFVQAITRPACKMSKGKLINTILYDQLNHSCLIEALRLADVDFRRFYKHRDMDDLERQLQKFTKNNGRVLILTDGVFSMEGDIAPLDKIVDLAVQYKAVVVVDDAHATGVLGKNGKGTCDYFDITEPERMPIQILSFSKAIGGLGSAIIVDEEIARFLWRNCRNYIFCGSISPFEVDRTTTLIKETFASSNPRDNLNANARYFRQQLISHGFKISGDTSIIPVHIGASVEANDIAQAICAELYLVYGVYCRAIEYPVVPTALLRFNLTATHKKYQIDHIINSLVALGIKYQVIKNMNQ